MDPSFAFFVHACRKKSQELGIACKDINTNKTRRERKSDYTLYIAGISNMVLLSLGWMTIWFDKKLEAAMVFINGKILHAE